MKMTKEIEEFINLTITEHMGKSYADWKLSQSSVTGPDEIEEAYKKVHFFVRFLNFIWSCHR